MKLFIFLILFSSCVFAEEKSEKLDIEWIPQDKYYQSFQDLILLKFDMPDVDAVILKDLYISPYWNENATENEFLFKAFFKGLKKINIFITPPYNSKGKAKLKLMVRSKGKTYYKNFVFDVKYKNRKIVKILNGECQ